MTSEIRKEYNLLYKENQDLKAEMQNLRNYYDREKLISQNKKAMRNFPSRSHKRKIRYKTSHESSGNEETDHGGKYIYQKRKKYDDIDGNYDDADDDSDDYADDKEFSENDNDNNDNDEKRNKNKNKKVIQKQKQKPKTQNKKGISKSIKV